ncbi:hypothetical protein QVD17_35214 [Tagetes erecta]|uniref:Transmembrane protein n=1 Tax=Tagetes erecta TaxID=13708 RepID=A0AAD8K353_TARER|nr:hypothetical protein QVD17_35214 [Tagetes erecta]
MPPSHFTMFFTIYIIAHFIIFCNWSPKLRPKALFSNTAPNRAIPVVVTGVMVGVGVVVAVAVGVGVGKSMTFYFFIKGEGVVWTRRRQGGEGRRSLTRCRARGRRFGVRGRGCARCRARGRRQGCHRLRRGGDELPPRLPPRHHSVLPYPCHVLGLEQSNKIR